MAGGRGILDANGKLLIRSDGTVDVCEECCNVYSRWQKCGSETGEIYTRDSDAAPNPFLWIADGTCWSRVSTGNSLPGGATLLDPADWTTDAGCCVGGGCCGDYPRPATFGVTFAGVSNCTCVAFPIFGYRFINVIDDLNGTYCLPRTGTCLWSLAINVNMRNYGGPGCTNPTDSVIQFVIRLQNNELSCISSGGTHTWFQSSPALDCSGFVVSNDNTCPSGFTNTQVGGGGTATTVPNC